MRVIACVILLVNYLGKDYETNVEDTKLISVTT